MRMAKAGERRVKYTQRRNVFRVDSSIAQAVADGNPLSVF